MGNEVNEIVATVTLKTWDRAFRVIVNNIWEQPRVITFLLERAQLLDGVFSSTRTRDMPVAYDPLQDYPLLNPEDDSVIPNEQLVYLPRHIQIQVLLYSQFKYSLAH